jgi:YegS/Rv2252/BmrU family lipid kinase
VTRVWFAVLNPVSGGGRGRRHRGRIEACLREAGIDVHLEVSQHPGHTIELARAAASNGFRRFIAIGGDGTLNELVNGAQDSDTANQREIQLALIPVGRGNDWARTHRIPGGYAAAAGVVARGRAIAHDLGVAEDRKGGVRYFVNVAGVGFDAHVVRLTRDARMGALTYLAALPRALMRYRASMLEIVSSEARLEGDMFVAFAAVGRYCGGGMLVAPDALFDDGLLDVTVVRDISRLELLRNLRRLFDGSVKSYAKVETLRTRKVEIEATPPVDCQADGELLASTPVRFSVIPHAVRVMVP